MPKIDYDYLIEHVKNIHTTHGGNEQGGTYAYDKAQKHIVEFLESEKVKRVRIIDDLSNLVDKIHKDMMEFMRTVSFDDMKDPKVDKRCGTCKWFPLKDSDIGCYLGHHIHKWNDKSLVFDRYDMRDNDDWDCSDWKAKPDKRCGTCGNLMRMGEGMVCSMNFMGDYDGTKCTDWTGKPKEKKRVWTCLYCFKDIVYSESDNSYIHIG